MHALWDDHSVVFFDKDVDLHRMYFFSNDLHKLEATIKNIEKSPITVDIVSKEYSEDLHMVFVKNGFSNIALYKRLINNNLPVYHTNSSLLFAGHNDLSFLYKRLFKDFDKYKDHLPSKEELKILIESIFVAPFMPKWKFDLVKALMEKFDLNVELHYSSLEGKPVY